MSINADDIEHRISALHLVLVETLGHVGKDNPEVLEHLGRLFVAKEDKVTTIRPGALKYAEEIVAEAKRVADTHR